MQWPVMPLGVGVTIRTGLRQADIRQHVVRPAMIVRGDWVLAVWACGVTPQSVVLEAKLPLVITHKPGSMLVTDKWNADLAAF